MENIKFGFFYDNGVDGSLSLIVIEAENEDSAWVKWNELNTEGNLCVRMIYENVEEDKILFQE